MNSQRTLALLIVFSISAFAMKTNERIKLDSKVHNWNELEVQSTNTGERRQILDGETMVFDQLEIHVTTLLPGKAPHKSHTHQDFEELIIVKEGKIKQTVGTEEKILSAGSIVVAMPGDEHGLSNAGDTNATYYIIKWRTRDFKKQSITTPQSSIMHDWQEFEYKETSKGGRRSVIRQATPMLQELEMHVTTLDEGMTSHGQHTHADEEIILVLKGEVEELINDVPNKAEAGSLIFLNSNIPHGIRNIGKGQCEYFAIRWIPRS
jgi:(S)-ureidoglycine aminohydrolase